MAQILNLSKIYTKEQLEQVPKDAGDRAYDLPAGGYICKIVRAILNNDPASGKANIELHIDIAVGEHTGYFQRLENMYGFWGLKKYMSFKLESMKFFRKDCMSICNSNPGFKFDPEHEDTDVENLVGKKIGVVTQKEEYRHSSGEIRERDAVYFLTEVSKIEEKKFKIPPLKKLKEPASESSFRPVSTTEEIPY